jgi:hypothetical protein
LFTMLNTDKVVIGASGFKKTFSYWLAWLKRLPTIEKVKQVVRDCDGSNALARTRWVYILSPFTKKTWSLLSSDIFAIVNSVFHGRKLPRGISSSFMVLIPKKFKSISLIINGLHKIMAKLLSSRLKYMLTSVISIF